MNTSVVGIAARLVTVVTIVMLDRVAAKQRSGIALVLSSPADINHQRAPPLRRFAASRSHVSIADRAYIPICCARNARTNDPRVKCEM